MVFAHLVNPTWFFVHEIQPIWISLRPLRQDHGNHLFSDITLKALPDFLMRIRRAFRYFGPHLPRIRTWVRYGMTARQVAEVYGVAVGEIERIVRKA
jgi:hypothetical protein